MFRKLLTAAAVAAALALASPVPSGASTVPASAVSWNGEPKCAGVYQGWAHAGAPVQLVRCNPGNRNQTWVVGDLGVRDHTIRLRGTGLYLAVTKGKVVLSLTGRPWHYYDHSLVTWVPYPFPYPVWLSHCPGSDGLSVRPTMPRVACRTFYVFTTLP